MNHPDPDNLTRTIRGPRNLLEICLDLRMAHNGSADPISPEETDAALAYLRHRLATWTPRAKVWAQFDDAVFALTWATITEVERSMAETARLLALPEVQSTITGAAIDTSIAESRAIARGARVDRDGVVWPKGQDQ